MIRVANTGGKMAWLLKASAVTNAVTTLEGWNVTGKTTGSADGTAATRESVPFMEEQSAACRVLVVDDEPLIRWAIAATLSELGYTVVEAGDGKSALEVVAEAARPVDVILLDYRLPDSDNLTLLSTIRRMAPTSQVIMMTALGTPDLVKGALERGACRVMNKPPRVECWWSMTSR
jgi:CheY-like chemotaxis protein